MSEKATPKNDSFNIVLLVVLYLLQGIPLGLSFGSVPYLLKSKLNYSDLALFSLSSYPYSLKVYSCYLTQVTMESDRRLDILEEFR